MRPADYRDLAHGRMPQQYFLDLARINVGAAADDHVLGAVPQRQETVLVERSDVAGMQPAVAQRFQAGVRIAPVAAHDGIAANQDFADLPGRQRPVLLVGNANLYRRLRDPNRSQPLFVTRVFALADMELRQCGDRHGRFALAINLRETRPHHLQRALDVPQVHRAAAVDDGFQPVERWRVFARMGHHAMDHGRCREHRHAAPAAAQLEYFRGLEMPAFGNDLVGSDEHVRKIVLARTVRHGRRMQYGIVRRDALDSRKIGKRHAHQVAVRDHHAFRPSRRSAGVEQPGHIVGRRFAHGEVRLRAIQRRVIRRANFDHAFQHRQAGA